MQYALEDEAEEDLKRLGGVGERAAGVRGAELDELVETYEAMPYSRVVRSRLRLLGLMNQIG